MPLLAYDEFTKFGLFKNNLVFFVDLTLSGIALCQAERCLGQRWVEFLVKASFNIDKQWYSLLYSSNNSNKKKFALYVKLLCFVIYVKYVKLFIKKLAQKCLNIKKFNTIFNVVWYNPERSVIGTALSQNI